VIVLDTHVWIWWAGQSSRLSKRARKACESADEMLVSAITLWEVAMLVAKERLGFDREVELWIRQALALPAIRLEPLTPSIAVRSTRLPGAFHGDPADRIIVATALEHGATVVTRDAKLRGYQHLKTVW
jgi:PIN domain nuclease of toxin-antitoxin system